MRFKVILILLLGLGLLFFGCVNNEQQGETECPEGYSLVNGSCVPVNDNVLSIRLGESFTVDGQTLRFDNLLYDTQVVDGDCHVSDISAVIKGTVNGTEQTYSLHKGDILDLKTSKIRFKDVDYDTKINRVSCTPKDVRAKLKVRVPEYDEHDYTFTLNDTEELSSGVELSVPSIRVNAFYQEPMDIDVLIEMYETSKINSDLSIKYLQPIITTSSQSTESVEITKGEDQLASLPGDYAIMIDNININVNPADSDTEDKEYEVGDSDTFQDDTKLYITNVYINMTNCSDGCTVVSKYVNIKYRPRGTGEYLYANLTEGDEINLSSRVLLHISSIDVDTYCYNNTEENITECRYENVSIGARVTVYGTSCSMSDRSVSLRLIRPDSSEEHLTLDNGEARELVSGEYISVEEISGVLSDPILGECNLTNKTVRLSVRVPVNQHEITQKKVKLRISYKGDEYTPTLGEGDSYEVGDGITLEVKRIDAELDCSGNDCDVEDSDVAVHVSAPPRCKMGKKEVLFSYDDNQITAGEDETFTIQGIEYEVKSIEADITPNEDESRCEVDNKKVRLTEYRPVEESVRLKVGENETIGGLVVGITDYDADVERVGDTCKVNNKKVELFLKYGNNVETHDAEEGDKYSLGDYTVLVDDIDLDLPDKVVDTCKLENIVGRFEILPSDTEE